MSVLEELARETAGADVAIRAKAEALLPELEAGAAAADEGDRFVAENYARLRAAGLVEAGVPVELGGGGAEVAELAEMLRILAHGCGSTALAFAMHTHQVAIPAWRWRHRQVAAMEPLLRRIAAERLILLSSGGSDWIGGSGEARRVECGYRITARKVFTSGAEAGDILMTGAILEEDGERSVLHFGAPMKAPEVRIEQTWRTLGMRGTGSNDVVIEDLFVADAAVPLKRKAGEWHPLFQIIATIAFPLIYGVYLGVAESARDIAVGLARKRPPSPHALALAGRMETALRAAQIAHGAMLAEVARNDPSERSVNEVMIGRTLVGENAIRAVELAMELAGGAGFYRAAGLERRFRDVQGARYHPLQAGPQAQYAGAMALGQPVATIY
ncbi:MAG TPA: acyl-CoA dehydrogenase family protein [Amaricoccus sp.]|uniref:acyl-CoA dehydrogenase family protein n=1 Tax=Amaricoccus sp. TaxID=1872485 RepID=UPI002C419BC2|nr:acyl-CoA dehydrogenase family protein [Amaricoccus sp.]HMQ91815.1 acyl-CoA dehydrogenase family protein [Amaricoccus sp.]HMR52030.1 acyl-CoA dehydrogenase family protein [Amaricoccus sp.]HMR61831.1 acyl-CoA dehydrogenase family protein [Amaricoccus sp.]HMT98832.1 acyl-CoA dehydrogenase family protein [Amaricoccus sp.]